MTELTFVEAPAPPRLPRRLRADLIAVGVAVFLAGAAAAVGIYLNRPGSGVNIFSFAPPIFGHWLAHVGPGSLFAVMIAVAGIMWGPALAQWLSWGRLLSLAYVSSVAWTFSLAMIDGWTRGFTTRLTQDTEYLHEVPGITDIPTMLRQFSSRILDFQPHSWTTHVSGHPPGATLVFVWLDRIGLGGGAWAATACVVFGCLAAVAVPATLALLGRPDTARAVAPFAVLTPGAIWVGASADGLFTGVTATGIALLALSARGFTDNRGYAGPAGFVAGLILGFGIFLSYGLMLLGLIALAVVVLGRQWRVLALALIGAGAVVVVFAAAGFWWVDGYHLVVERYYQGIALYRPYSYWVWADVAALAIAVGPAVIAAARRTVCEAFPGNSRTWDPVVVIALAALLTLVFADLSGLSKAEVERIWLPFGIWLIPACALLPSGTRRWWLAGQAGTALAVNHLILTNW